MLKALEVLHEKGFVHCDVQPKNVLIDVSSSVPRLTLIDFGACLRKEVEASKTRTWEYSAPEQWNRETVDEKTDVFGTAGVLFYLLTGRTLHNLDSRDIPKVYRKDGTLKDDPDKWEKFEKKFRDTAT